jgi:hypothetical protein
MSHAVSRIIVHQSVNPSDWLPEDRKWLLELLQEAGIGSLRELNGVNTQSLSASARDGIALLLEFYRAGRVIHAVYPRKVRDMAGQMASPVALSGLGKRAKNCLHANHILYFEQLAEWSHAELRRIPGLTVKLLDEIETELSARQIQLPEGEELTPGSFPLSILFPLEVLAVPAVIKTQLRRAQIHHVFDLIIQSLWSLRTNLRLSPEEVRQLDAALSRWDVGLATDFDEWIGEEFNEIKAAFAQDVAHASQFDASATAGRVPRVEAGDRNEMAWNSRFDQILEQHLTGASIEDLGHRFGVSKWRVQEIIRLGQAIAERAEVHELEEEAEPAAEPTVSA